MDEHASVRKSRRLIAAMKAERAAIEADIQRRAEAELLLPPKHLRGGEQIEKSGDDSLLYRISDPVINGNGSEPADVLGDEDDPDALPDAWADSIGECIANANASLRAEFEAADTQLRTQIARLEGKVETLTALMQNNGNNNMSVRRTTRTKKK